MMTALISISKADVQWVSMPLATDAIGSTLREAFVIPPLPEDMADLLRRLDRRTARR